VRLESVILDTDTTVHTLYPESGVKVVPEMCLEALLTVV
jgi:hypothetical protein